MPTSKLRAPAGFGGLAIEGRTVEVGKDGSYHADHRDIAALRAHGFTDWHDHPGAGGDVETMTKAQLVDEVLALTRAEVEKQDPEYLRAALRRARAGDTGMEDREPTEPSAAAIAEAGERLRTDPNAMTEERIINMNRPELFAFLRARNASIGATVKTDALRSAALAEFRKAPPAA